MVKAKCPRGTKKLKSPVRRPGGAIRRCTLKKKSAAGRSADRKKRSGEFHEVRFRKDKRKGKR